MSRRIRIEPYDAPAGGWGSMKSLLRHIPAQGLSARGPQILSKQNKPEGYSCVSCAWAKPAKPHAAEFCENGAKATVWELTERRTTPEFFEKHTVSELLEWPDYDLEVEGRLTHPMRYDAGTDRYVPVSWDEAFADIGAHLKRLRDVDPKSVVFYMSGRASLETSYAYQLLARLYGNNNLPDSSNMCHESTSKGLQASIGVPVGTVHLDDFQKTDCIFFFGQNVGSNSPRMLHDLQKASERGVPIVTFNPLRERGLIEFVNPQRPGQMLTNSPTRISTDYHQVRAGGDIAAMAGIAKALVALDDSFVAKGKRHVLDHAFLKQHTEGAEAYIDWLRNLDWREIEENSGLDRAALEEAAQVYAESDRVIFVYGMGLTQHRLGVENVRMLVNLALLRGNVGKLGAGICPVRGHSNVQGQRTVGIADDPDLVPLDRLAEQYGFEPPREAGLDTVGTCKGVIEGSVKAFIGMGGNFVRAVPDRDRIEPAWRELDLSVQVATKLNRSHLITAKTSYLLPCLGRLEIDRQETGPQAVTIEDSLTCIHVSRGQKEPASPHLLSELKIVAEIAKATLPPNPKLDWDAWVRDYSLVRDAIEETWPDQFSEFNKRMWEPGGFARPLAARGRVWETGTGKANFLVPEELDASFARGEGSDVLRLITLRSNDQFNTTVYGYRDRFRGIEGTRDVVLMNRSDIARLGLSEGGEALLSTVAADNAERTLSGLRVVAYDIPEGCCAAYYPEANVLIPLDHHARDSHVPAAKSVPVRISAV
jgi:molybdopterin-dependent oxidoreductase alpha subunit